MSDTDTYPPDWSQRAAAVYERDGYTCQNCGAQGGPLGNAELHAHHIVDVSSGGSHQPSNLITPLSRVPYSDAQPRDRRADSHQGAPDWS